jgi:hypothetical protein
LLLQCRMNYEKEKHEKILLQSKFTHVQNKYQKLDEQVSVQLFDTMANSVCYIVMFSEWYSESVCSRLIQSIQSLSCLDHQQVNAFLTTSFILRVLLGTTTSLNISNHFRRF